MTRLTHRILDGAEPAFALLCRAGRVEIRTGDQVRGIDAPAAGQEMVAALPYRHIAGRGLACVDDGTPLLAFVVSSREEMSITEALQHLPDEAIKIGEGQFETSD